MLIHMWHHSWIYAFCVCATSTYCGGLAHREGGAHGDDRPLLYRWVTYLYTYTYELHIYIYFYMHIHTHIHTFIYTHMYLYTRREEAAHGVTEHSLSYRRVTYAHTYIYIRTHANIHTHIYLSIHIGKRPLMEMTEHSSSYRQVTYIYIYIYIHAHTNTHTHTSLHTPGGGHPWGWQSIPHHIAESLWVSDSLCADPIAAPFPPSDPPPNTQKRRGKRRRTCAITFKLQKHLQRRAGSALQYTATHCNTSVGCMWNCTHTSSDLQVARWLRATRCVSWRNTLFLSYGNAYKNVGTCPSWFMYVCQNVKVYVHTYVYTYVYIYV